jgi:Uma2 family endonuclease
MAVVSPAEQQVILKGISWETYERLLGEHEDESGIHFTYDSGALEIMVLSARHERPNRVLATLVEVLAEELGIDLDRLGSITLKRPDLLKGFEPDSCFYIQHVTAVMGKEEIDLATDPPPDLLIEVDVTSVSLPKLPIFAAVGIPEVWRYTDGRVIVLRLGGDRYSEAASSLAFPVITPDRLTQFLAESQQVPSTEWLKRVRAWIRENRPAR